MSLRGTPFVLVVDDADDNRLLYATTIAQAGYVVEEATNGQEAIDKIGAQRPAIIVMDLSMPVLDGWEAIRRIKANPKTADIVIIALTAHATNYGLQQAKDAGAGAVLTKPCLPRDLLGVIGALLPLDQTAPPDARIDPTEA
jgi:CheY-like chemotaxis protein